MICQDLRAASIVAGSMQATMTAGKSQKRNTDIKGRMQIVSGTQTNGSVSVTRSRSVTITCARSASVNYTIQ